MLKLISASSISGVSTDFAVCACMRLMRVICMYKYRYIISYTSMYIMCIWYKYNIYIYITIYINAIYSIYAVYIYLLWKKCVQIAIQATGELGSHTSTLRAVISKTRRNFSPKLNYKLHDGWLPVVWHWICYRRDSQHVSSVLAVKSAFQIWCHTGTTSIDSDPSSTKW